MIIGVLESVEDNVNVPEVFRPRLAIDEDVIKEYQNKFMQLLSTNVIHKSSECRRGIA